MNLEVRQRHKETFTTVFTGLVVNYPLNLLGLYICIDLWGMTDTFRIGTTVTAWMTVVAYCRVYTIRRYFGRSKQEYDGYIKYYNGNSLLFTRWTLCVWFISYGRRAEAWETVSLYMGKMV